MGVMHFLIQIIFGFTLASISAAAFADTTKQPLAYGTSASSPRVLWTGQRALVAFYDDQGALDVWNLAVRDAIHKVSPLRLPEVVNSWIDFSRDGKSLYLIWRPKFARGQLKGNKIILFSASDNEGTRFSPPVQLNTHGGAFHPHPLVRGGNGLLYLVWADERLQPEGIYFNRSTDDGKTWLKPELRMDRLDTLSKEASGAEFGRNQVKPVAVAYDPFIAAEKRLIWLGWSEIAAEPPYDRNVLKFRVSTDAGTSWSAERKLPTPNERTYNVTLLRTGDGKLLLFYYVEGGGILVTHSEDGGETWSEAMRLGGTVELGGQRFKTVQNRRGTVCLTWEGPNQLEGEKADVFIACSQDFGKTWPAKPTRLDTNEPRLTHSLAPRMAMDDSGNIVVAWQDSRYVRPNIYLNYSRDAGQHWARQDIPLDPEPGRYQSTYPWVDSAGDGRFLVTWRTKDKDGPDDTYHLSYTAFTLPGITAVDSHFPTLEPTPARVLTAAENEQRQSRLAQRIREYWQAMVNADYAKAFSLMDPFYRAGSNMMLFGSPQSKFQYHGFRLPADGIAIAGNIATFQIKVVREAPMFIFNGKKVSIPKQEIMLPEKWVWVDEDWYRVYENEGANFLPL